MEASIKNFCVLVESEGNSDWQLYVYMDDILLFHQEYDQKEYSEEEICSIGMSYLYSITGSDYND